MPSHLKLVKKVIALGWERYGDQISIWGVTHFWENVFLDYWSSKCCETPSQAIYSPIRLLPHVAGDSWGIVPHVFGCFLRFPMAGNLIWEMLSGWDPPWAFLLWFSSLP